MEASTIKLIDKEALENAIEGAVEIMRSHGLDIMSASVPIAIIKAAPTVDAVPVVRCRDCVWYTDNGRDAPVCDNLHRMYIHRRGDWFCANGERRDDDDADGTRSLP